MKRYYRGVDVEAPSTHVLIANQDALVIGFGVAAYDWLSETEVTLKDKRRRCLSN